MINPQVEERLKAAKPQLDAIVASIRGQQAADKIASAASRASRERGYTPSVRPTVTGSVSPQQYIDQVMSALQPQMQRTIEEAQRSASARLGQIGTYDSGFGQKLLSEQEANIRAQALANAVSQGLQYGNLDLARLSEAFGQQYSLANLANQIRQAQLSREQQERLAMLPYQQLTAAQRAELPLREAEITKMYKGEMTPDYRRLISDMTGIDPVTGQPTFGARMAESELELSRQRLAQEAALARQRLAQQAAQAMQTEEEPPKTQFENRIWTKINAGRINELTAEERDYAVNRGWLQPPQGEEQPSTITERRNAALAEAYSAVDIAIAKGATAEEIQASINDQYPDLVRRGVDPNDVFDYLQRKIEAGEVKRAVDLRPFWQKVIDIIPGRQYR